MGEEPKIIVDSDWKSQAQAEKERLEKAEAAKKSQGQGATGQPDKLRFEDVVRLLTSQALAYLGYVPDPQTGQAFVSLEYARLYVDMLGVLEEKTKGNLTPEEQKLLTETLHELRMAFVETARAVQKAVKEGRVRQVSVAGTTGEVAPTAPDILTPPAPGLST
jgi:hypothetical protein